MRKQGRKPGKIEGLINENPPKLDEKTKRKTDHLMLCTLLYKGEKPLKPC